MARSNNVQAFRTLLGEPVVAPATVMSGSLTAEPFVRGYPAAEQDDGEDKRRGFRHRVLDGPRYVLCD